MAFLHVPPFINQLFFLYIWELVRLFILYACATMITQNLIISLLQNTAILISAVLLYDYLWVQGEVLRKWYGKILAGILVALIGYLLFLTPWIIQPGLLD